MLKPDAANCTTSKQSRLSLFALTWPLLLLDECRATKTSLPLHNNLSEVEATGSWWLDRYDIDYTVRAQSKHDSTLQPDAISLQVGPRQPPSHLC